MEGVEFSYNQEKKYCEAVITDPDCIAAHNKRSGVCIKDKLVIMQTEIPMDRFKIICIEQMMHDKEQAENKTQNI